MRVRFERIGNGVGRGECHVTRLSFGAWVADLAGHVSDSARFAAVRYGDRGWAWVDSPLGGER